MTELTPTDDGLVKPIGSPVVLKVGLKLTPGSAPGPVALMIARTFTADSAPTGAPRFAPAVAGLVSVRNWDGVSPGGEQSIVKLPASTT